MTAIEMIVARLFGLRIIWASVACLMIQSVSAQQPPAPEVLEYKGTVAAAREADVAPASTGF
jgi:hypothetical protein